MPQRRHSVLLGAGTLSTWFRSLPLGGSDPFRFRALSDLRPVNFRVLATCPGYTRYISVLNFQINTWRHLSHPGRYFLGLYSIHRCTPRYRPTFVRLRFRISGLVYLPLGYHLGLFCKIISRFSIHIHTERLNRLGRCFGLGRY